VSYIRSHECRIRTIASVLLTGLLAFSGSFVHAGTINQSFSIAGFTSANAYPVTYHHQTCSWGCTNYYSGYASNQNTLASSSFQAFDTAQGVLTGIQISYGGTVAAGSITRRSDGQPITTDILTQQAVTAYASIELPGSTGVIIGAAPSGWIYDKATASASNSISGNLMVNPSGLASFAGTGARNVLGSISVSENVVDYSPWYGQGTASLSLSGMISYNWVSHSMASFGNATASSTLQLDFGDVVQGSGQLELGGEIFNIAQLASPMNLHEMYIYSPLVTSLFDLEYDSSSPIATGQGRTFKLKMTPGTEVGAQDYRAVLTFIDSTSGYGQKTSSIEILATANVIAVPEPQAWALVWAGLLTMLGAGASRRVRF
jgi:hypothetical protein